MMTIESLGKRCQNWSRSSLTHGCRQYQYIATPLLSQLHSIFEQKNASCVNAPKENLLKKHQILHIPSFYP